MPFSILHVATAVFVANAGIIAHDAGASATRCGRMHLTSQALDREDADHVCRGADAALRFLASQGLVIPPAISVDIVDEMPEGVPKSALGVYAWKERRVILFTYRAFRARENQAQKFGVPINRSHYRAAVSHEVAHAIVRFNFRAEPSLLAGEYISYVTLFHVLPAEERKKILGRFPYQDGWEKQAAFMYMSDPMEFGTHAYRHFLRPENGAAYLNQLLSGEAPLLLPGE